MGYLARFLSFSDLRESVTIRACQSLSEPESSGMCTDSLALFPARRFMVYSGTLWQWSSRSPGGEKNGLWCVWPLVSKLLRQEGAADPRPVVRRQAGLPGRRAAASGLSELRQGEERDAGMARGQPALHEAFRVLRGKTVPLGDDQGRGAGVSPRLAHGQGAGEAVHAGAAEPAWCTPAEGDRHRRSVDQEGAYVPHHRQ